MAGIELMKAMVGIRADSQEARGDISSFKQFVEQEMQGVSIAVARITGSISAFGVKAIGAGLQLAGSMEQSQIAFATMLGSAEAATDMLEGLNQFAASTPFEIPGIVQATKTLLAFQIPQEDIMGTLKSLGDVSAGTGKDFAELAVIYGKIASNGKLMGGELNQLIDGGFNPLNEISKATGKSVAELKDEMSKGNISFEMAKQAFIDATSEGGQFFNMMEAQSKSLFGLYSTLQDGLGAVLRGIGQGLMGPSKALINLGITAAEVFGGMMETTGNLVPNIVAATTAMTGLTTAVIGATIAWRALSMTATKFFIATGVGIFVVAIGAAIGGIITLVQWLGSLAPVQEALARNVAKFQEAWERVKIAVGNVLNAIWGIIKNIITGIAAALGVDIASIPDTIGEAMGMAVDFVADFVLGAARLFQALTMSWDKSWELMKLSAKIALMAVWDLTKNAATLIANKIANSFREAIGASTQDAGVGLFTLSPETQTEVANLQKAINGMLSGIPTLELSDNKEAAKKAGEAMGAEVSKALLEPGRYGFKDIGTKLQDAYMKSEGGAADRTATATEKTAAGIAGMRTDFKELGRKLEDGAKTGVTIGE